MFASLPGKKAFEYGQYGGLPHDLFDVSRRAKSQPQIFVHSVDVEEGPRG